MNTKVPCNAESLPTCTYMQLGCQENEYALYVYVHDLSAWSLSPGSCLASGWFHQQFHVHMSYPLKAINNLVLGRQMMLAPTMCTGSCSECHVNGSLPTCIYIQHVLQKDEYTSMYTYVCMISKCWYMSPKLTCLPVKTKTYRQSMGLVRSMQYGDPHIWHIEVIYTQCLLRS